MINAQIQARLNHKISKPLASTDKNASHPNLHHGRPALPADAFCRCTRSEFYNPRDPRDGVLPWQVVPSGLGWLDHSVRAVLCRPSELDMDGSWVFIHSQESYPRQFFRIHCFPHITERLTHFDPEPKCHGGDVLMNSSGARGARFQIAFMFA